MTSVAVMIQHTSVTDRRVIRQMDGQTPAYGLCRAYAERCAVKIWNIQHC